MRMLKFSARNIKEILRDPLNLAFGLGFPVVLLLLLSAIQANIPVELFAIERLSPGVAVFGLSFMTLFISLVIAKDKESAFITRLYATPLKCSDFIFGYALPMIVISLAQCVICYALAIIFNLPVTVNLLYAILLIIPVAILYISLGVLFGSILSVKAVGGVCGALLTNLSAWLSGIWFDLELVGGAFKTVADLLPFVHAVELQRAVVGGAYSDILPHLLWVLGYTAVISAFAVVFFYRQMKKQ